MGRQVSLVAFATIGKSSSSRANFLPACENTRATNKRTIRQAANLVAFSIATAFTLSPGRNRDTDQDDRNPHPSLRRNRLSQIENCKYWSENINHGEQGLKVRDVQSLQKVD